ncbi:unnamed protein product, partial [marine sediment metagenome]
MPQADDKLRLTIVHEISGVATRNDCYYDVVDPGTISQLSDIAVLLAEEWERASETLLSNDVRYVAYLVDNLSRNEVRGVVTSSGTGNDISGSHPQDQVVRFNEYGHNAGALPLRRGAFNLSGVGQQFSDRGRINDETEFNPVRLFLSTQFVDSPSTLSLNPQIRTRDPGGPPVAYSFHRTERCNVSTRLFKLKSR